MHSAEQQSRCRFTTNLPQHHESPANALFLYPLPNNEGEVKALIKDDTIWLTQRAMAQLFGCSTDNVSLHLKNIYNEDELSAKATTEDFSVVQQEGHCQVQRQVVCYNLDAIISVGYRVNSQQQLTC